MAGAAFGDILGDSRRAKSCIFSIQHCFQGRRVRSPKRRVQDGDFMVGSWSDHGRVILGAFGGAWDAVFAAFGC